MLKHFWVWVDLCGFASAATAPHFRGSLFYLRTALSVGGAAGSFYSVMPFGTNRKE